MGILWCFGVLWETTLVATTTRSLHLSYPLTSIRDQIIKTSTYHVLNPVCCSEARALRLGCLKHITLRIATGSFNIMTTGWSDPKLRVSQLSTHKTPEAIFLSQATWLKTLATRLRCGAAGERRADDPKKPGCDFHPWSCAECVCVFLWKKHHNSRRGKVNKLRVCLRAYIINAQDGYGWNRPNITVLLIRAASRGVTGLYVSWGINVEGARTA